jgi:hypothetical protein
LLLLLLFWLLLLGGGGWRRVGERRFDVRHVFCFRVLAA